MAEDHIPHVHLLVLAQSFIHNGYCTSFFV